MNIKTEFVGPAATVIVHHEQTTAGGSRVGSGVLVTESEADCGTLTTINIRLNQRTESFFLLWQPPSWNPNLSILLLEETSMLFVGGGTFSAVLDVGRMELVHQHKVDLFWSFQPMPNSVLELGEIECFLYSTNGKILGSVPVDPPYDVIDHGDEVEFVTSLFGRPRLRYPSR